LPWGIPVFYRGLRDDNCDAALGGATLFATDNLSWAKEHGIRWRYFNPGRLRHGPRLGAAVDPVSQTVRFLGRLEEPIVGVASYSAE